jgi:hypothetical protein
MPTAGGVRWVLGMTAVMLAVVVLRVGIERGFGKTLVTASLIILGFGFPASTVLWLFSRGVSTVRVYQGGIVAPSTLGFGVAIRWEEVEGLSTRSTHGLAWEEVHRHARLNDFVPTDVFDSREFQRIVGTTPGSSTPLFIAGGQD